jgi:hypothetical protein
MRVCECECVCVCVKDYKILERIGHWISVSFRKDPLKMDLGR